MLIFGRQTDPRFSFNEKPAENSNICPSPSPDLPAEELPAVREVVLLGRRRGVGGAVGWRVVGVVGRVVVRGGGGGRLLWPPLLVLAQGGRQRVTLQPGRARDLDPPDHLLPDGVHHGQAGDVVHGGLPGQHYEDVPAVVVHQVVVSVVLVGDVHGEGVGTGPQTGLEPVPSLAPHVQVELGDVEGLVVQELDLVRPQLLQAGLLLLREPLQEDPPRDLGVVRYEDLSEVDSEPGAPD